MLPAPMFLGFRAKQPWKPDPQWWPEGVGRVERVCSVSDCLAEPPPGWIERWDFNRATCYGTEAQALATVPQERQGDFEVFAYWLMPVTRDAEGHERPVDTSDYFPPDLEPLPEATDTVKGYDAIGYDVVATPGHESFGFGHSPLSCNSMVKVVLVNRDCLIDSLEDALRAAQLFNAEQPEPGDYAVVKVAIKARR